MKAVLIQTDEFEIRRFEDQQQQHQSSAVAEIAFDRPDAGKASTMSRQGKSVEEEREEDRTEIF